MALLIGAMLLLLLASNTGTVEANPYGTAPVELDAGVFHDCAFIKSDGNVNCWGTSNTYGQSDDYLGGDAIGFAAGSYANCVLLPSGNTHCWGRLGVGPLEPTYPNELSYMGGDALQVSVGYDQSCVLTSAGNVNCYGFYLGGTNWHSVYSGGAAEWVVLSAWAACIKTSGTNILTCLGWNLPELQWDTGGTPLPAGGGYYAPCILTAEGNVDCQNNNYNNAGQFAGYQGGDAIDTDAQFQNGCAATSGGDVRCWGYNAPSTFTTWAYVGVDARSVSVGTSNICWADSAGVVSCTGNSPDTYTPPSPTDTTPPDVTAPAPLTVECTSSSGISHTDAVVQAWLSSASATDIVDGTVAVTNDASGTCALGTTTINFSATDAAGHTGTASSSITVEDNTAPVVTAALIPVLCPNDDRGSDDDSGSSDDDDSPCGVGKKNGVFQVSFSCSDACDDDPQVTSTAINGIVVTDGQIVKLQTKKKAKRGSDDDGSSDDGDRILKIKAPSFELKVTCEDAAGNQGMATAAPTFATNDDKSSDDDESSDDN